MKVVSDQNVALSSPGTHVEVFDKLHFMCDMIIEAGKCVQKKPFIFFINFHGFFYVLGDGLKSSMNN